VTSFTEGRDVLVHDVGDVGAVVSGSVNLVDHPQRHRRIMPGFRWRGAAGQRL
jgi:hypothetical protein